MNNIYRIYNTRTKEYSQPFQSIGGAKSAMGHSAGRQYSWQEDYLKEHVIHEFETINTGKVYLKKDGEWITY